MGAKRVTGLVIASVALLFVVAGGLMQTEVLAAKNGPDERWLRWFAMTRVLFHGMVLTALALFVAVGLGAVRTGIHVATPAWIACALSAAFGLVAAAQMGYSGGAETHATGFVLSFFGAVLGTIGGYLLTRRPLRRPFSVRP